MVRRILHLIFLIGFVGSSSDSEENISVILLLLSLLLLVLLSVVGYPIYCYCYCPFFDSRLWKIAIVSFSHVALFYLFICCIATC